MIDGNALEAKKKKLRCFVFVKGKKKVFDFFFVKDFNKIFSLPAAYPFLVLIYPRAMELYWHLVYGIRQIQ